MRQPYFQLHFEHPLEMADGADGAEGADVADVLVEGAPDGTGGAGADPSDAILISSLMMVLTQAISLFLVSDGDGH